MKKILIVFLIAIALVLLSYLGIKNAFFGAYENTILESDTYWKNVKDSLDNNEAITITRNTCTNCYEWANLKFEDNFSGLPTEEASENGKKTSLVFKDNLSIEIGTTSIFSSLSEELQEILKSKDITTDIEVLKYIADNYNKDLGFFTSIKELKESSEINKNAKVLENSLVDIKELNGEYNGYLVTMSNNIKYAVLTVNNVTYSFTFYQNNSDEQIISFIGSIVIE